jgi:hypothetical protein
MLVRGDGMQVGADKCRFFAANPGLQGASVAVIPGRKSTGMLVVPVSNAVH